MSGPTDRYDYIRQAAERKQREERARLESYLAKPRDKPRGTSPGERCLREENPPDHRTFDVDEQLNRLFFAELRGPWERRVGVYHPSSLSLGTCKRALYHDRLGTTPRPSHRSYLQAIFDEGHGTHEILQRRLKKGHLGFHEECGIEIPELHISGSADGVFDLEDWIFEIKTMGDAGFSALVSPKKEHVWQLHAYMFARDIPRAQLLYVNRNNGKRRNFKVYFQMAIWDQIVGLVKEIEGHVERKDPPPMATSKYECSSCKFQYHCFTAPPEESDG